MGWYGQQDWKSKQDVIDYLSKDDAESWKILEKYEVSDGLWRLVQTEKHGIIIAIDLIEQHQGTWMYKPMDESMGPYYYDCPVEWLERAPVLDQEWRDGVMKWHESEKTSGVLKA